MKKQTLQNVKHQIFNSLIRCTGLFDKFGGGALGDPLYHYEEEVTKSG